MIQKKQKKWLSTGLILFLAFFLFSVHADAKKEKPNNVIEKGDTVSISYTLTVDNKVVDKSEGSNYLTFKQGAQEIIPGLDNELIGMKIGDTKKVKVVPKDGYGNVMDEAILELDKSKIPEKSHQVGTLLEGKDPKTGKTINARVTEIKENTIVVDLNHPLAGKSLYFDIEVKDIEKAP